MTDDLSRISARHEDAYAALALRNVDRLRRFRAAEADVRESAADRFARKRDRTFIARKQATRRARSEQGRQ